jgi:hypothetical protein
VVVVSRVYTRGVKWACSRCGEHWVSQRNRLPRCPNCGARDITEITTPASEAGTAQMPDPATE